MNFPTYCSDNLHPGFARLDNASDRFIELVEPGRGEDPIDALKARERELKRSGFHDAKAASKLLERFGELTDEEFSQLLERLRWLETHCSEDLVLLAQAARCPDPIRAPAKPHGHTVIADDEEGEELVLVLPSRSPFERLSDLVRDRVRATEPLADRVYRAKDALAILRDPFAKAFAKAKVV